MCRRRRGSGKGAAQPGMGASAGHNNSPKGWLLISAAQVCSRARATATHGVLAGSVMRRMAHQAWREVMCRRGLLTFEVTETAALHVPGRTVRQ